MTAMIRMCDSRVAAPRYVRDSHVRRVDAHETRPSGPGSSTLPLYVFGQVKRGVSPETNAVAAMIFTFTIAMLLVGQFIVFWQARRRGASDGSMAKIIAER